MTTPLLFNRPLHHKRLARADEDFLLREMCARLGERLDEVKRPFARVLDISSHGRIGEYIPESAQVERLVSMSPVGAPDVRADEEYLPFAAASFDLVIACGSLHFVNDLPGTLAQIKRLLKPDGLLLAMLPGSETLKELRSAFEAAELALRGGISPRVSPFVEVRDAGALLQRAGFALPVVDREVIDVSYEHPLKLLRELRRMGQSNALVAAPKGFTPASLVMQMCDYYMRHFSDEQGRIHASFEMVTMTAWAPDASQPQPAKRGSGSVSLSVLGD
jgi:SAM-dependent methyltransferase